MQEYTLSTPLRVAVASQIPDGHASTIVSALSAVFAQFPGYKHDPGNRVCEKNDQH